VLSIKMRLFITHMPLNLLNKVSGKRSAHGIGDGDGRRREGLGQSRAADGGAK
jgi:hypothetical protein